MGQGCGSVGRAVASGSRGLRFKSSHRRNIYWTFTVNCIKKTKIKIKEAGNSPLKNSFNFFKIKTIVVVCQSVFFITSSILLNNSSGYSLNIISFSKVMIVHFKCLCCFPPSNWCVCLSTRNKYLFVGSHYFFQYHSQPAWPDLANLMVYSVIDKLLNLLWITF